MHQLYEVSDEPSRLISMEGLRGFAVLLVFFVHFDALFSPSVNRVSTIFILSKLLGIIGHTGVDLFFVLSGCLIYGALIRHKASYHKFIRRRVERIYPTFLSVLCLYLALSLLFPNENKIHGSVFSATVYVLQNLLLLPGIFHITPIITVAWSLSYEFFFYLSIPLLVWLTVMGRWRKGFRVVFFMAVWLGYLAYSFTVPTSKVRLLMLTGILLYEAISSDWLEGKLGRRGEIGTLLLFLGSLTLVYLLDAHKELFAFLPGLHAGRTLLPGVPTYQGPYRMLFLGISCLLLGLYCFAFDGFLKRLFSWNPLRYLGNMSYSYYLIHGITLNGLAHGARLRVSHRIREALFQRRVHPRTRRNVDDLHCAFRAGRKANLPPKAARADKWGGAFWIFDVSPTLLATGRGFAWKHASRFEERARQIPTGLGEDT